MDKETREKANNAWNYALDAEAHAQEVENKLDALLDYLELEIIDFSKKAPQFEVRKKGE